VSSDLEVFLWRCAI